MDWLPTLIVNPGSQKVQLGVDILESPSKFGTPINFSVPDRLRNILAADGDQMEIVLRGIAQVVTNIDHWDQTPVLITAPATLPRPKRENIIQQLIENNDFPLCAVVSAQKLALLAAGFTTGVVVDIGASDGAITPIYESYTLPDGIQSIPFGGDRISSLYGKLTSQKVSPELQALKEKECVVMPKVDAESLFNLDKNLQPKQIIPELVFRPSLAPNFGCSDNWPAVAGIHEYIQNTILKCPNFMDWYKGLVVTGGTSWMHGFVPRLEEELKTIIPCPDKLEIIHDQDVNTWIGGVIMARMEGFKDKVCVTRDDYDEFGPTVVHRKCIN